MPKERSWSVRELEIALDAYLYMLRLQIAEIPFTTLHLTKPLLEGPLKGRTRQDFGKKMRHISDIFKKRNLPLVKEYNPISNFSRQIREDIDILISKRAEILLEIIKQNPTASFTLKDGSSKLKNLELALNNFEIPHIYGLGHNNPPEPITDDVLRVSEVKESLKILQELLSIKSINSKKMRTNKLNLLDFGLRLAIWIGERITDFSRAAAVVSGTGAGIWLSGKAPSAFDAMKALIEALQSLN